MATNLRFLLSLGGTKIVVLQDENDLHIYSTPQKENKHTASGIAVEHVSEALSAK